MFFNILIVLIAIGFVIFIHELGHFVLAKFFGVTVEKFSIGFGKEIFGFTKKETRYSLAIFPLGGFVKMQGENFLENVAAKAGDFINLHYFKRILVVSAGAIMNILFAVFVVFFMTMTMGIYSADVHDLRIGSLQENKPAIVAGMKVGDILEKIGDREIKSWNDVVDFSLHHDGKVVDVAVNRNGEILIFKIKPFYEKQSLRYLLGVANSVVHQDATFLDSVKFTFEYFKTLTQGFLSIFKGHEKADFIGPVGVIKELTNAINQDFLKFLFLLALVSFNLGLVNLLPLPILDGGHILIYLFEWISGKRVSQKFLEVTFSLMFIILISFMIFVTNKDILRILK